MPTKEDGSCIYLAGNECSIYEDRPFICNIDAIRKKHYGGLPKEKFYEITAKSCNALMDEGGVDSKYRVDMGQFSATPHPPPQPHSHEPSIPLPKPP